MSQIEFDSEHEVIVIRPKILPDADEFELWASIFLHHPKDIQILDFAQGADRHQMRFKYHEQCFSLNFEHYSDSIWISPEGQEAVAELCQLSHLFLPN